VEYAEDSNSWFWSYRTFSDELKHRLFVPVSISDVKDIGTLAALFEVDSNYGRWAEEVSARDKCFIIGGHQLTLMPVLTTSS